MSKRVRRKQMSVYPSAEDAVRLGGWSSAGFNLALHLFAQILHEAADRWPSLDAKTREQLHLLVRNHDLNASGWFIARFLRGIAKLRGLDAAEKFLNEATDQEVWRLVFHHLL